MASQKNETAVLVLALFITLGLVWGGFNWFTSRTRSEENTIQTPSGNQSLQLRISFGEKTLFTGVISGKKQAGLEAIASQNFPVAKLLRI